MEQAMHMLVPCVVMYAPEHVDVFVMPNPVLNCQALHRRHWLTPLTVTNTPTA
jgi:hypothetical protein